MEEKKIDRRTKYTKMVIQNSLFELLKQKSIDKITVTDICLQSDINRGTFYYYYADVFDLLKQIESEIYEEFLTYFNQFLYSKDRKIEDLTIRLFEYLKQNKKIFRIIFSKNGDKNFIKTIYFTAYKSIREEWKSKNPNLDEKTLDDMFTFIGNGSISVIQKWLESGAKEDPKQIAEFINLMSQSGFSYYLNQETKGK